MGQVKLHRAWPLLYARRLSNYYLAALNVILIQTDAEKILAKRNFFPKALKGAGHEIFSICLLAG